MVDIHGDESNVKTVNIFNTSNGNFSQWIISKSGQHQSTVPGTDFSAIAIGKEITYVFKSVAEVEKFNLGFFNGSTGIRVTLLLLKKIFLVALQLECKWNHI